MFSRIISISFLLLFFSGLMSQTPETGECLPPSKSVVMEVNNVRTTIHNSNEKWWDKIRQRYEVPKDSERHSMFAGSLWIGGLDENDQLRFTGGRYDNGDFFPGPLSVNSGEVDSESCVENNQIWMIHRWEVEQFIANQQNPDYQIPESILTWPAHGNVDYGQAENLAPFYDNNGDGVYNPEDGDYPAFNISGELDCEESLKGDVCVYWIVNDSGNDHESSGGLPLGVEIHGMAYAYASDEDAINDATFYEYKVINRSLNDYHDVYFAHWSDPDLGCALDDYTGCDVERSMGYVYNGELEDDHCGQQYGYGEHPPAIGVRILDAPWSLDEPGGEHIKMSHYTYFINQSLGNPTSDPQAAQEYYNYMQGFWKDGSPFYYGGNGHFDGMADTDIPSRYTFPGDSDQENYWGTYGVEVDPWSEETAGNPPGDRRMVMTNGPFDLASGEEIKMTIGVPWARDMSDPDPMAAVAKLQVAADVIQEFHESCYEQDCVTPVDDFIYQLQDENIVEFGYMFDGFNFFWTFGDGNISTDKFPIHQYDEYGYYEVCLEVTNDCGQETICKLIKVGDPHNEFFSPKLTRIEGVGNSKNFLDLTGESRNEIFQNNYAPHITYENGYGPVHISVYDPDAVEEGDYSIWFDGVENDSGWKLFKVGGTDTVHSDLTISNDTSQYIPQWGLVVSTNQFNYSKDEGIYTYPLPSQMVFEGENSQWLTGLSNIDNQTSRNWIASGLNLTSECWGDREIMSEIYDSDEHYEQILGGTWTAFPLLRKDEPEECPGEHSSMIIPSIAPVNAAIIPNRNPVSAMNNVDIVITADKSKWSRVPVVEMQSDSDLAEGGKEKLNLRSASSVDKEGSPDGDGIGMGWFPGYAIDIDTGERLNMAFGEDSHLSEHNGNDMLWNPVSIIEDDGQVVFGGKHVIFVFRNMERKEEGLMPAYDEGQFIRDNIELGVLGITDVYKACTWVGYPLLEDGHNLLETDVTIKLRVEKRHDQFYSGDPNELQNNTNPLYNFTLDMDEVLTAETLGVNENGSINFYPNPFSTQAYFKIEGHHGDYTLRVYDLYGKLVREQQGRQTGEIIFNRKGLAQGTYIYAVQLDGGNVQQTGKMVVMD